MSTSPVPFSSAHACAGPLRRRDTHRHWLCVLCPHPTRITNLRHSRPWGEHGRAHEKCIRRVQRRQQEKAATVAGEARMTAASLSIDSNVQSIAAATSTSTSTSAAASASDELVDVSSTALAPLDLPSSFAQYGFARIPASAASRHLSWQLLQLSLRSHGDSIAGNVRQLALSRVADSDVEAAWVTLVKTTATNLGIHSSNLHVVDSKLLIAAPKQGDQPVHWDAPRDSKAHSVYSCLLVCAHGCYSTALPRFPTNDAFSFSHDPTTMQSVAPLLDRDQYESLAASAGDIIFFRQSTPHYGVQNTLPQGNRVMLFGILSASDAPGQDELQVFPWLYIGAAFGRNSFEFARSLVEGRMHKPLVRIAGDEGSAARDSAIACLKKWNLLDAYNGTD